MVCYPCTDDCMDYCDDKLCRELSFHEECFWTVHQVCNGSCHVSRMPKSFRVAISKDMISDVFMTDGMQNRFQVEVIDGEVNVNNTTPFFMRTMFKSFIIAYVLTLLIELAGASIYRLIAKKKRLKGVFIANLVSLPVLWPVVWAFPILLILGEIAVVFFEGWFILWLHEDSLSSSMFLSLLLNLASLFLGGFLLILMLIFIA